MNVNAYQISLIGGGFIILGVLIGSLVGYWFSKILAEHSAINHAKTKLRSSFAPAQAQLLIARKSGASDLMRFFNLEILRHAAAIEEFRPFASDSIAYQQCSGDYLKTICDHDTVDDSNDRWIVNSVPSENGKELVNYLEVIEDKIKNILHFAAPK